MKIYNKIKDLQQDLQQPILQKKKIGFVPTMGALHSGHISLVEKSKSENDFTVVSIFVNPIQFNNPEDLEKYPRNPEKDFEMLKNAGVDFVFYPEVAEMYPEEVNEKYNFGNLETVMEGAFRPGHFNGVAVVVRKLFDIVKPSNAYFGEKDFQQLAIIKKMVHDYSIPVQIVPCSIVREPNGLAMSSRNARLSIEERNSAKEIFRILKESKAKINILSLREIEKWATEQVNKIPFLETEYFQIVDSQNLQQVDSPDSSQSLTACIAVYAGKIRLIDNLKFK
ncbi:MAG: pantoate--beta-alanine ligase [Bacteroidales bacterium]|nr:pantoate--beta-alanine ligase [Bacteroidales bacterium]